MTEPCPPRKKIIESHELPLEILQLNILPRLPTKSVFRVKCVCKQWQSYLSTYEFAMLHRNHNTKSQTSHKLLIVDRPPWRAFPSFYHKASKNGGLATFRPMPFDSFHSVYPLASLDGLVCVRLQQYRELVIWNPLTGGYKWLADSKSLGFYCFEFKAIGLYIDSSNDYKLLHINSKGVYIYSLRMNSWRKIQDLEDTHVMSMLRRLRSWSLATFFDGSLYFTSKHERLIIRFDVKLEKFREIQYPCVRDGARFCGSLVVVKGCLHLCVSYKTGEEFLAPTTEIDLWQMNGDGWMEVVTAFSGIQQQMPLSWTPICVTKNGEWVVFWEHNNEDTKGFTREQLCLYAATSLLGGVVYNESLVSPNL